MSSALTLRTPKSVAEWRNKLNTDKTVGFVVDVEAMSASQSSCDIIVSTTMMDGVHVVVDVPEENAKGELWVEGGNHDATRALLLLSWIRPTHLFLTAKHSSVDMYKQLIHDFWFGTLVTQVDVDSSSK